ncbi:Protein NDR1 [Ananas comosus]|uniref:Protein NDR1 n=1 Tax=Ananas comosus TaxID=4615 RepID=A0A199VD45_ANACO|nr:Protein NDR1 [Ananas comosus]
MSDAVPSTSPTAHHHHYDLRTRYRARQVRESLAKRFTKLLCSAVLSLLFAAAFVLFILWLALRPHRPRFHVSSFSASPLPSSSSSSSSSPSPSSPPTSFSAQVSVRNPNRNIGFFFGPFSGSVYYRDDPVASDPAMAPGFYQPPKNTTAIAGRFVGSGGTAAETAAAGMAIDLETAGTVRFRMEMRSTVRFRVSAWMAWDTHRHALHVSCDVEVGPDGLILPQYKERRCSIYFF